MESGIVEAASAGGRFHTMREWRDRLLTKPGFRRWAARFPLTRPIARRRTRQLFDLCAGFVYSQILAACVSLKLFDHLAAGPSSARALAHRLGLPEAAMLRLLNAAASLGLVEPRGALFGLGRLGGAMVDNPGVAAMVEHHVMLYRDLADPVALLRGEIADTELGRFWAYAKPGNPAALASPEIASYTALMAASQTMLSGEILAAYDFGRHRTMLDVGGGDGTFALAAAKRFPKLAIGIFDLPAVAECAAARFAAVEATPRPHATGGDFRSDTLPSGADLITLVRVLHDHDDDNAAVLLRRVAEALAPGGTLLIAEPMSGAGESGSVADAYFGFYLLAMQSGRPRTPQEIDALLRQARFTASKSWRTDTPSLIRVRTAVKLC